MNLKIKKTLYLTKEEQKILSDLYWNMCEEEEVDFWELLRKIADDAPSFSEYDIEIID